MMSCDADALGAGDAEEGLAGLDDMDDAAALARRPGLPPRPGVGSGAGGVGLGRPAG